ncbi:hypothetical protein BDK92_4185 [Micromonospora pisi]|uniref:Uncharacterized protein n=1 Tax=Micromonospora pisi TaxID=589240 RepID=A0A495JLE8_9ACTN|nr:hypothetical protein [Micromonospora pisi]RKR89826.1 hypothetical protein BDK92_4185 [Micromonospora pisi]
MPEKAGHDKTDDPIEAELTEGTEPAEGEEPGEDAEPSFLNRAARRAQGKGATRQQQPQGKGKASGGRGSVQGPRQWGNRRSG